VHCAYKIVGYNIRELAVKNKFVVEGEILYLMAFP